jgi:hypothetical protein
MKTLILLIALMMLSGCTMWPPYNVWQQRLEGEADLAKAEYSKKVVVQDAIAKEESATHLAAAEVARAHGVEQANIIIGNSLKNNEAYLKWLYIEGLKERTGIETIYIPTEAGLPILEAGRKHNQQPTGKKE